MLLLQHTLGSVMSGRAAWARGQGVGPTALLMMTNNTSTYLADTW